MLYPLWDELLLPSEGSCEARRPSKGRVQHRIYFFITVLDGNAALHESEPAVPVGDRPVCDA